jgi:hypothetical protein
MRGHTRRLDINTLTQVEVEHEEGVRMLDSINGIH